MIFGAMPERGGREYAACMTNDSRDNSPAPSHADAESSAPAPGGEGLAKRVGHSMVWQALNAGLGKVLSFLAQIALGWLLLAQDFGVYAIAVSVVSFLGVFRTGGARDLMIQGGSKRYEELAGPLFWMAVAADVATAALLLIAAPIAAWIYGDPHLMWLIAFNAVLIPFGTPGVMLSAKLAADLRFREYSMVQLWVQICRYGFSVLFAWLGFGTMSFFLPLIPMIIAEITLATRYVSDRPWKRRAEVKLWGGFIRQSRWIIFTTFTGATLTNGESMMIGAFVAPDVLGIFFFARQIVVQTGAMLAWNFHQVLFPALSRMDGEWERQRQAMLRALSTLSLASALFMGVQAVTFAPLERLLWHGKWNAAVLPTIVCAILYPMRMMLSVAEATCYARMRFRMLGAVYIVLALALIGSAAGAAKVWGDPLSLAIVSGVVTAAACLAINVVVLKIFEIPRRATIGATVPAWLVTGVICVLIVLADQRLAAVLEPLIAPGGERWRIVALDLLRCAYTGAMFSAAMLLVARTLFPRELGEFLRVVPRGWGARAARWLRAEHAS